MAADKTRTILLTGANGLLGQKIVEMLASRKDVRLIATSRGLNRNALQTGYEYAPLDVCDEVAVREIFGRFPFTDVIHTAAMTNVDQCENDREDCRKLNVDAVRLLCSQCEAYGARMIHISTDFIFDGEDGPYAETGKPAPLSEYGKAKWEAEQVVMNAGIRWAIARTILLYGVVGDMSRSNIVLWAKSALEKGQTVRVVNDQWRTPTLAEDLADGVIRILMQDQTGIWHISGPEMFCIVDLVKAVAAFWHLDASLITETDSPSLNQPAKRPPRTGFVIDKARRELGYAPRSLREGLAVVDAQLRARQG